jgi:hypothetical protein
LNAGTVAADGKMTFNYETTDPAAYILGIVSYALVDTKTKNAADVKSFLTAILDPKCPNTDPSLQYSTITGDLLKADQALVAKIGA